jgi:hypothetical protein
MKESKSVASTLIGVVLSVALPSCASTENTTTTYQTSGTVPIYDVAPQVIYRIDGHRFISLENYDRCFGDNYYNDTQTGVRTKLLRGNSFTTFRGRLIVDDLSGMNIAIPSASQRTCGDRGCKVPLYYSTNGGKTFNALPYMNSSYPPVDSENYTIAVTKNALYIVQTDPPHLEQSKSAYVRKAPLYPLADLTNLDRSKGVWETGDKAPPFPSGLRTPSGQDRFTCDESIRPSNLPKPQ